LVVVSSDRLFHMEGELQKSSGDILDGLNQGVTRKR